MINGSTHTVRSAYEYDSVATAGREQVDLAQLRLTSETVVAASCPLQDTDPAGTGFGYLLERIGVSFSAKSVYRVGTVVVTF